MRKSDRLLIALIVWLTAVAASASAAEFAAKVISYIPGEGASPYTNAFAAVGMPDSVTGENAGFPNVLSPFSPPFETDEIVRIGGGGHITLRLARFAVAGPGPEIGVLENIGLADSDYPNGTVSSPAAAFGEDSAIVEASENGVDWVALNGGNPIAFNMMTMYFANAGPYDSAAPADPVAADFGIPFMPPGGLSAFDGLNYAEIVALFGGSAGGTWLDLSETGLPQVGYLRFSQLSGATGTLELDAVVIANSAVGAPVPEPSTLLLLSAALAVLLVVGNPRQRRAYIT